MVFQPIRLKPKGEKPSTKVRAIVVLKRLGSRSSLALFSGLVVVAVLFSREFLCMGFIRLSKDHAMDIGLLQPGDKGNFSRF